MEPLFESTNLDVNWDGAAQRTSLNNYKQMKTAFTVKDKHGNKEQFEAGDYVMGNSQFIWGVKQSYFDANYEVVINDWCDKE